jgi:hypothetical protein
MVVYSTWMLWPWWNARSSSVLKKLKDAHIWPVANIDDIWLFYFLKKNPALTKPLTTSTQLKKARSDIRPLVIKLYFNLNFQNWNIWHWLNSEINQKIEEPNIINISYRSDVCIFQLWWYPQTCTDKLLMSNLISEYINFKWRLIWKI